jgi:BASS family bile acid:Na+ symporter
MNPIALAGAALAWLGRQGTRAVATSIFVGLALPWLAAILKPVVGPAIFCLLVLAFLRVEPSALRDQFSRARLPLLLLATFWIMVATPLILGALYTIVGEGEFWNELSLALVMHAAAPPITSAPAFVALVGLDIALALALLVTATAATPVTAPFFAALFAGDALPLDALSLAFRLAFFLGGSFVVARLIRRATGDQKIVEWREHIDGLNVIALFVFAAALMGSVTAGLVRDPLLVFALLALTFLITFGLMAVTTVLFWRTGAVPAMSLGLSGGTRNMGLMLAAASGVSDIVWLYIAVAQFPIYLAPQLVYPIVSRIRGTQLPPGR